MALANIKNRIEMSRILQKEKNNTGMILAMSSFARIATLFLVFYQS